MSGIGLPSLNNEYDEEISEITRECDEFGNFI